MINFRRAIKDGIAHAGVSDADYVNVTPFNGRHAALSIGVDKIMQNIDDVYKYYRAFLDDACKLAKGDRRIEFGQIVAIFNKTPPNEYDETSENVVGILIEPGQTEIKLDVEDVGDERHIRFIAKYLSDEAFTEAKRVNEKVELSKLPERCRFAINEADKSITLSVKDKLLEIPQNYCPHKHIFGTIYIENMEQEDKNVPKLPVTTTTMFSTMNNGDAIDVLYFKTARIEDITEGEIFVVNDDEIKRIHSERTITLEPVKNEISKDLLENKDGLAEDKWREELAKAEKMKDGYNRLNEVLVFTITKHMQTSKIFDEYTNATGLQLITKEDGKRVLPVDGKLIMPWLKTINADIAISVILRYAPMFIGNYVLDGQIDMIENVIFKKMYDLAQEYVTKEKIEKHMSSQDFVTIAGEIQKSFNGVEYNHLDLFPEKLYSKLIEYLDGIYGEGFFARVKDIVEYYFTDIDVKYRNFYIDMDCIFSTIVYVAILRSVKYPDEDIPIYEIIEPFEGDKELLDARK